MPDDLILPPEPAIGAQLQKVIDQTREDIRRAIKQGAMSNAKIIEGPCEDVENAKASRYRPYGGAGSLPTECCNFSVVDEETRKEICRCWDLQTAQHIAFVININRS